MKKCFCVGKQGESGFEEERNGSKTPHHKTTLATRTNEKYSEIILQQTCTGIQRSLDKK